MISARWKLAAVTLHGTAAATAAGHARAEDRGARSAAPRSLTGSRVAASAGTAAICAVASAAANEGLSATTGSAGMVLIAANPISTRPAGTGVDRGVSTLTDQVAIEGRGAPL